MTLFKQIIQKPILGALTIIAESAQFSTAVNERSPPAYVGTTLTVKTCLGFALTMLSMAGSRLIGSAGCHWALAVLAVGPFWELLRWAGSVITRIVEACRPPALMSPATAAPAAIRFVLN